MELVRMAPVAWTLSIMTPRRVPGVPSARARLAGARVSQLLIDRTY
jgi:hypothetical protein